VVGVRRLHEVGEEGRPPSKVSLKDLGGCHAGGRGGGLHTIFVHCNAFVNEPAIILLPLLPVRPTL